jgi:phage terminase small subunit
MPKDTQPKAAPSSGTTLKSKQAAFAREFLVDLNATQAAIRAGYSEHTAESQGSRLLSNAKVKAVVDAAIAARAARVEVKADDVLRELIRLFSVDIGKAFDINGKLLPIHDIPEDVRRAIASVESEELFEGRGESRTRTGDLVKVKLHDKNTAVANALRHLGLLTDRTELSGKDGGPVTVVINKLTTQEE